MDTLLIQITNQKALGLIHELEELHLIKVLKENIQTKQKLSDKYRGKLPVEIANDMQEYVRKSRNEWDERNIL